MESILTEDITIAGDLKGSPFGMAITHLAEALRRMVVGPQSVCIVLDVGVGESLARFFACHTFEGAPGRSVTYAEGIKRVRPDVMVIVLMDAVTCAAGLGNILHAAARDVGVKVFVCSDVKPEGSRSEGLLAKLDLCQSVGSVGTARTGRLRLDDPDCVAGFSEALRSPGFAFVDLRSPAGAS